MLKSIKRRWKKRKKYSNYAEMPNWLLMTIGATSLLISGFYCLMLLNTVPEFVQIADSIPFH